MEREIQGLKLSMFDVWKHRLENTAKTLWDSRGHDSRRKDEGRIQWYNRDEHSMRLMWAHCKLQCPCCGHIIIHDNMGEVIGLDEGDG